MLAACLAREWPMVSYREPTQPLQRAGLDAVTAVSGSAPLTVGTDGCGVPVHALPLVSMAAIYARLGTPDRWGHLAGHAARAAPAMRANPYLVAGRNRPETAVMKQTPGVVMKGGAEGLL